MEKFIGFLDVYDKDLQKQINREEKLTIYVQNLSEIVKMIFAIV